MILGSWAVVMVASGVMIHGNSSVKQCYSALAFESDVVACGDSAGALCTIITLALRSKRLAYLVAVCPAVNSSSSLRRFIRPSPHTMALTQ